MRKLTCIICGGTFFAKRKDAKLCSDRCRGRSRTPRAYDAKAAKQWRQRRLAKPGYREMLNRQANERAITIRRWLDAYKLKKGCVDCGYRKHAVALDFDHVRGKKRINVCNAKSIAQARAEIALCEVRCACCHRVKTVKRGKRLG